MGINASKVKVQFDGAAAVTLRDVADGAETATATEAAISLSELDDAYWQDGDIPHGVFEVVVHVTAISTVDSDNTYQLDLVVDDTSNMSDTPRVVASLPLATRQTGVYYMYVDSRNIPKLDTDSSGSDKWMAIKATLAGTSKSITYGAWISRSIKGR